MYHETKGLSGHKLSCILNFSTRWRRVASFILQPLYTQDIAPGPQICKALDRPQSQFELVT